VKLCGADVLVDYFLSLNIFVMKETFIIQILIAVYMDSRCLVNSGVC
jgi:hypothetical protein